MAEQIKIIETKDWKGRLILVVIALIALVFAWFAVRWQIGNMLAALTPANDPNAKQIAEFSHTISPHDPITNWYKANVEKNTFTPESLAQAVAYFEEAVRNAPADYRYWVELGRAHEQIENYEKAEKALLQALKVAPNYSNVHWQLGNFYLRRGREEESFAELRKAADASPVYSEQVFGLVWDYYEKDTSKLDQLANEKDEVKASLAKYYAVKERSADSLRIWNTLSEEGKQRNSQVARLIAQGLYEKRFYRAAVEFIRQTGIESQAQAETVQNGGFELPITNAGDVFFDWRVNRKEKIEINTDPLKKKEGNKSLRVSLNGFTGIELRNILQIVAVQPGKKYRVSFWLKTDNLKSAGTPMLEIINANDEKIITTSAAFPGGTSDWTAINLDFTAPSNAEAVALRFDRAYCGDACPIVGTFWVDDFKIQAN